MVNGCAMRTKSYTDFRYKALDPHIEEKKDGNGGLFNNIQINNKHSIKLNNGIVTQLQRLYAEKKLEKPQFIGCQHPILDLVLRLSMDIEFSGKSTSPNIEYSFIQVLLSDYKKLKMQFTNGERRYY